MTSAQMSDVVFSPENLSLIVTAAEALSEPRRRSYWWAPRVIPITTPNGESIGSLVWDSQRQTYRFHVGEVS